MIKKEEGFTLVELLVVIVILGILAGIGLQQFGNVRTTAANSAHEANVILLKSAARIFYFAEGEYDKDGTLGDHIAEWPQIPENFDHTAFDGFDEGDSDYLVRITGEGEITVEGSE